MATIEKSIDVQVPVSVAYDQWTQFEEFPQFMEGVVEVKQLDDSHVRWVAEIGGERKQWDAEIVEQEPDRVIAWRSVGGTQNSGRVEFQPSDGGTRVTVAMDYETEGMKEAAGAMLGFDEGQVEDDLERFKALVESRGTPTGAWGGRIESGEVVENDGTSS
ncbi:MAG TPA: SRPBCC family protein [Gaiellaceae bacterium]|nr:SRPBCC family protein [Gaiellaceae bacterium]